MSWPKGQLVLVHWILEKQYLYFPALSGALMGVMLMSTTCFAAGDTSAVTQPLENLKPLIIAVIGAVGVIILPFKCFGDIISIKNTCNRKLFI